MAKLKEADFYYGSIISMLLNNKICPILVEGGTDRQVYEFTTNEGDFKLFLKYRSEAIPTKMDGYQSWQFSFSADDIAELRRFISDDKHLSVGLVCGMSTLSNSEYAVLHKEEIGQLLDAGKTSLTISRKSGEKAFRISVGGGRENALQVKSSRKY